MDDYRYPIGAYEPVGHPSPEQRNHWIMEISEFPKGLRRMVEDLTTAQLLTPYRPGGWTIQQVVHHIADNNINAIIRFKRALTEDNPTAGSYHEELWAELGDYRMPVEASLVLISALHSRFIALLGSLSNSDYRTTFISPTHGMIVGLGTIGIIAPRLLISKNAWDGNCGLARIRLSIR